MTYAKIKKSPIHIVQLIPALNEGGVERGVVELNAYLVKKGYKSTIITYGGKQIQKIIRDGGDVRQINIASKNPIIFILSLFRLKRCLQTIDPDILHARSRIPAWQTYIINKSLKIPFVTTVHGFNHISKYSEIMTKGDRVIAVSNPVKDHIVKHYNTSPDKIRVIHRGLDPIQFNPDELDKKWIKKFKDRHNLHDSFVISIVGRITELKDHPTFLKAIKLLAENRSVKALIVGGIDSKKISYYKQIKKLINELNIENNVIFTGSQSKLPEIYNLSDITVSASKKPESFGRTIIESLALNTPVIATNHGGSLDIIPASWEKNFFKTGDSNDLYQKILAHDHDTPINYRKHVIDNFDIIKSNNAILDVYNSLIKTE